MASGCLTSVLFRSGLGWLETVAAPISRTHRTLHEVRSKYRQYLQWFSGTWYHPVRRRGYLAPPESRTVDIHWQCLILVLVFEKTSCWDRAWRRRLRVPRCPDPTTSWWPSVWMASGVTRRTHRAWQQRTLKDVFLFPCHLRLSTSGRTFCIHGDWCRNTGYKWRFVFRRAHRFFAEQPQ